MKVNFSHGSRVAKDCLMLHLKHNFLLQLALNQNQFLGRVYFIKVLCPLVVVHFKNIEQTSLTLALTKQGFSLLSVYWKLPFFHENELSSYILNCFVILVIDRNVNAVQNLIIASCGLCFLLQPSSKIRCLRRISSIFLFLNCLRTASSWSDVRVQSFFSFTGMGYCLWSLGRECNNVSFPGAKT